jgi:hypothetical protein
MKFVDLDFSSRENSRQHNSATSEFNSAWVRVSNKAFKG